MTVELHLHRWEARSPRARLLVIHGLGDHGGRYAHLAGHLTQRGVTVTAPDLPGHGRSPGRRGDARSVAALLARMGALRSREAQEVPDRALFLLGHSMGGLLVLRHVQLGGGRGLAGIVLSAPWLATGAPVPGWKLVLGRVARRLLPGLPLSTGVDPELLSRDPSAIREYREDPLVHHRVTPRLFFGVREAQREARSGPPLNVPALVLVPGGDELVDPHVTRRFAAEQGGEVRVAWLPDARHEPWNDLGKESVFRRIGSWIEDRLDAREDQNPGKAPGYA